MSTAENAESAEESSAVNQLTAGIIGCAVDVHRALGPGLLKSSYEACLCYELAQREISFQRQVPIQLRYKQVVLDCGYRADVIVNDQVLIGIKAVDALHPIHDAQLLSYLRLGGWQVGLIINFNVQLLKHGIRRRVLNLPDENSAASANSAV